MRVLSFRVLQVALRSQVKFLRIYPLRRHASPAQSRALHRLRLRNRLLVALWTRRMDHVLKCLGVQRWRR